MSLPPPESSVLNFVIRMVVPMRREFGRSLDVQLFMRDADYARSVLDRLVLTALTGWEDMLLGEQTTRRAQTLAQALKLKLELS